MGVAWGLRICRVALLRQRRQARTRGSAWQTLCSSVFRSGKGQPGLRSNSRDKAPSPVTSVFVFSSFLSSLLRRRGLVVRLGVGMPPVRRQAAPTITKTFGWRLDTAPDTSQMSAPVLKSDSALREWVPKVLCTLSSTAGGSEAGYLNRSSDPLPRAGELEEAPSVGPCLRESTGPQLQRRGLKKAC